MKNVLLSRRETILLELVLEIVKEIEKTPEILDSPLLGMILIKCQAALEEVK